jgi:hypothetical protein
MKFLIPFVFSTTARSLLFLVPGGEASLTSCECRRPTLEGGHMLYTIAVILVVLWLLGMVTSYTVGGFIHLLLVLAIIVVLLRVIQGRTPV